MSLQTRRDFSKLALAAIPAAGFLNLLPSLRGAAAPAPAASAASASRPKPNSKVNGVSIGMNVPYNYQGVSTAADILNYTIDLGISAMELRSGPVEAFMGAPGGGGRGGGGA